jgi:C4-dicarboxylate-specific signal transduction histidine kinase
MPANLQSFPWLDAQVGRFSRPQWAAIIVLLVGGVAWLDDVTGFEYSMRIAYLLPIFLATWMMGRAAGLLAAVLCVAAWALTGDHLYLHPLQFAWNSLVQLCVFLVFATVLFRLRMALANADQRFVAVLEGLESAVYVVDEEGGDLLYMNPKGSEVFGREHPATAMDVERRFGVRPAELAASSNGAATQTLEVQDAVTKKWYWLTMRPIRWVNGRSVQLHIATDISERKRAEELARERQEKDEVTARLVTAGEMASLLAHELNQPLAAIANYNMGCVRRLASGEWHVAELREALEKSTAQAVRAGSIIQGVREFLHKREPDLVPCDINGMITDVAQTVQNETARHEVRTRLDLDPNRPQVLADTIMLKQVLLNLIRNGLESMDQVPAQQRELVLRSRLAGDDTLEVEVADRGAGLPAELAANPFRPFFTTKADGMGMGLQICRSIVELHDGKIWAAPNPGGGTVFHFTLGVARP